MNNSKLTQTLIKPKIPRHVAIIMDGNGRWAQQRTLPRMAGHRAGVEALREVIQSCQQQGIEVLTVFAFSSENWQRPNSEVKGLMELLFISLGREIKKLHKNNIKFSVIGDISRLNKKLQKRISDSVKLTGDNTGPQLVLAINYGGRWDITNAAKKLSQQVQQGELTPEQIDENRLTQNLSTKQLPELDLFIRTSGEKRISNFLLWQLSYAELYFTETLWPDFKADEFNQAILYYQQRKRRFGLTSEQMESH